MEKIIISLCSIFLISCGNEFNVEYQICDNNYKNCKTSVKFSSMEKCEDYKIFQISYCDHLTTPGKMICDTTKKYEERLTSFCKISN